MKIRDIADEIITGVLTRRVVWEDGNGDPSLLKSEKILVPKAINDGLIDHSLLQEVKLYKEVKDKFYTKKGDVIMKLSTPYDSCVIEKEEDEGLIVPSFSLIIRKINPKYNPYFVMAFLSSKCAWSQIKNSREGRVLSIINNVSVAELDVPELNDKEIKEISNRYKRFLNFKRLSTEIISLEKERNDSLFLKNEED
ncbi:hypothetical protein FYJ80_10920 [Spirochaetales bacterium NM-380-WT-3C1]|uniref:Type I restriction modification DNA specificity domain-containing protein n=1 Tax=Bullifex porci TaxID=2606638 RepID=A0A7X2PE57_9SPIO|nr:hypothetical protein [Bullifex porci]MSU07269.1 hypothetical protein [Bullifex porci]